MKNTITTSLTLSLATLSLSAQQLAWNPGEWETDQANITNTITNNGLKLEQPAGKTRADIRYTKTHTTNPDYPIYALLLGSENITIKNSDVKIQAFKQNDNLMYEIPSGGARAKKEIDVDGDGVADLYIWDMNAINAVTQKDYNTNITETLTSYFSEAREYPYAPNGDGNTSLRSFFKFVIGGKDKVGDESSITVKAVKSYKTIQEVINDSDLLPSTSLNWNASEWEATESGSKAIVDNSELVITPATNGRGDIRITKEAFLYKDYPVFAIKLKTENATIKNTDVKIQTFHKENNFMYETAGGARAQEEIDMNQDNQPDLFIWNTAKITNVTAKDYNTNESATLKDYYLENRYFPYAPGGDGNTSVRSFMKFVLGAKDMGENPSIIIEHIGSFSSIEEAKDFFKEDTPTHLNGGKTDDLSIRIENRRVIADNAEKILIYSIDGMCVHNEELTNGIYIVKAIKNGASISRKITIQ